MCGLKELVKTALQQCPSAPHTSCPSIQARTWCISARWINVCIGLDRQ